MKISTKIKIVVPLITSGISLIGQIFHSKSVFTPSVPIFISYSLIIGFIGYFIVDFVTATGHLQRKVQFVKLLVLYFVFLIVANQYLIVNYNWNFFTPLIQLILTILITTTILIVDIIFKPEHNYDFIQDVKPLPRKYLRPRPIKTILETIFRLFPTPEPVVLYRVGNPGDKSPVIVTGNYELTVRRVAKSLQGLDCWLLICDSRGINVWCSSLSGHFSEKNITHAIELTHLSKYVSHKKIILPQLCAPGVDIKSIKQKTGFTPVFGPVYIEYIHEFLNAKDNPNLRKVKFEIWQRIEMAIASPIILVGSLTFIYLFIDLSKLLFLIPIIYFIAVVHGIIYPHIPIKQIPLWRSEEHTSELQSH